MTVESGILKYPLPFDLPEFRNRVDCVRAVMKKRHVDVLLISSPENIYYLTAFQTTGFYMFQCLVLPLQSEPFILTREAEAPWVKARSWVENCVYYTDNQDPLKRLIKTISASHLTQGRIAIEKKSWFLTVYRFESLRLHLPKAHLVDGSGIVESVRVFKSSREIEYMKQAAVIVDSAMRAAVDSIQVGANENDLAAEVYRTMISAGSAYPAENPYICSGKRTGIMHASYENRRLEKGDLVFFEIPACVNRYHAAMMRTACIGEPPAVISRMADASLRGLEIAIDTIRPGITSAEIDHNVRSEVARMGFEDAFKHRTGYSIGIAFPPNWGEEIVNIREKDKTVIKPGMVFHVILSLRRPELGGTGFSETIAVTENGARVLGNFERRLIIK